MKTVISRLWTIYVNVNLDKKAGPLSVKDVDQVVPEVVLHVDGTPFPCSPQQPVDPDPEEEAFVKYNIQWTS